MLNRKCFMGKTRLVNFFIATCIYFLGCASIAPAEDLTIRIHCWEKYAKPYVAGFKKVIKSKYNKDIEVIITSVSNPSEFWELSRAKKVDIISPAHNIPKSRRWKFVQANVALPIDLENIPNYKHLLAVQQKNSFVTIKGRVFAVPYAIGHYGLAYNADKVKKPVSWSVLLEDNAMGKYSISRDYSDCNIYITALMLGASYDSLYDIDLLLSKVSKQEIQNILNKLATRAASLWEGTANPDEFSELSYAATWGYGVAEANRKGGNWKMAQPKEGATAWIDHWLITYAVEKDVFKKKICEEWINYCLSPDVQVGVIRNWGVSPVVVNIKNKITQKEINTFRVGDNKYWKALSYWENQNTRTSNFYQLLWKQAASTKR